MAPRPSAAKLRTLRRRKRALEREPQLELSDFHARTLSQLPAAPSRTTIASGRRELDPQALGKDETYAAAVRTELAEEKARKRRRRQYFLRRVAAAKNPAGGPKGLPHCGCRPGWEQGPDGPVTRDQVSIMIGPSGKACWGGVARCSSVWCCPVCAPGIASYRAEELEYVLTRHLAQGGGGFFATLTMRHNRSHRARQLVVAFRDAWRGMTKDSRYGRRRDALNYAGYTRGKEVTHGDLNGWHLHGHVLVLTEQKETDESAAAAEEWMYDLWASYVEAQGLPRPLRYDPATGKPIGVCVLPIRSHEIGRYMAKLGLALEVSSDLGKEARAGNRTPWELLNDVAEMNDKSDVRLWQEYAAAMKGERQLTWSRGSHDLRKRYGLAEELTDEQVTELEQHGAQPAAYVSSQVFRFFARVPGFASRPLDLAESIGPTAALEFVERCVSDVLYFQRRELPPWWDPAWSGRTREKRKPPP